MEWPFLHAFQQWADRSINNLYGTSQSGDLSKLSSTMHEWLITMTHDAFQPATSMGKVVDYQLPVISADSFQWAEDLMERSK